MIKQKQQPSRRNKVWIKLAFTGVFAVTLSACSSMSTHKNSYHTELRQVTRSIENITSEDEKLEIKNIIAMPFYIFGVTSMGLAYLLSQIPDCESETECTPEDQKNDNQRFLYTLGFGVAGYASWQLGEAISD